nr:hypothetical protein Ccrd_019868 [Ipomoea trifida]
MNKDSQVMNPLTIPYEENEEVAPLENENEEVGRLALETGVEAGYVAIGIFDGRIALGSIGFLPQAISRATMPKLYMSVSLLAFPVKTDSGAMYPIVPANVVIRLAEQKPIEAAIWKQLVHEKRSRNPLNRNVQVQLPKKPEIDTPKSALSKLLRLRKVCGCTAVYTGTKTPRGLIPIPSPPPAFKCDRGKSFEARKNVRPSPIGGLESGPCDLLEVAVGIGLIKNEKLVEKLARFPVALSQRCIGCL